MALGKENVRAVLMPSQYSTSHSVADAEQLSLNVGNPYDIISIDVLAETVARMCVAVIIGAVHLEQRRTVPDVDAVAVCSRAVRAVSRGHRKIERAGRGWRAVQRAVAVQGQAIRKRSGRHKSVWAGPS